MSVTGPPLTRPLRVKVGLEEKGVEFRRPETRWEGGAPNGLGRRVPWCDRSRRSVSPPQSEYDPKSESSGWLDVSVSEGGWTRIIIISTIDRD